MSVRTLLLGRDREAAGYLLLVGVLLAVLAGSGVGRVAFGPSATVVPVSRLDWLVVAGLVAVPAVAAAVNDGLLVCWLLEFALLFAVYLDSLLSSTADPLSSGLVALVVSAAVLASIVAPLWGTVGFVIGAGGRRVGRRLTGHQQPAGLR